MHNKYDMICNSANDQLRDLTVPYEVLAEALRKPCPVHGYMHSLSNSSYEVVEASKDNTAWPDMPIRRIRDHPHPYCSHSSCYHVKDNPNVMVCSHCHDVIKRTH